MTKLLVNVSICFGCLSFDAVDVLGFNKSTVVEALLYCLIDVALQ